MSEQIISKRCSKCKNPKQLSEFSKRRASIDGLQSCCKSCDKAYKQGEKGKAVQRKADAKRRAGNPNYVRAFTAVNHAIRAGKLPRPDTLQCHYCPARAQQYHHWRGYEPEYWLDVVSACRDCHRLIHKLAS